MGFFFFINNKIIVGNFKQKNSKCFYVQNLHWRNMSRGVQDRFKLEEEAGSGFVQCDRKTYRNKMPDQVSKKKYALLVSKKNYELLSQKKSNGHTQFPH